jgi:hypothetical protein
MNNGIIHALRTETVSLSKLLDKQKKENVIELERREVLISENTEKKKIIHEKVCYIAEQARIAKNTKIDVENRTKEFKEEKKNLLRYILQQNEITNDLSMVILSMRAVVRTSNSYVLPYLYTPGKDSAKIISEGKEHGNDGKSEVPPVIPEIGHFRVPEIGVIALDDEGDSGGNGMNFKGAEETKLDCEEERDKDEELKEEMKGKREAEKGGKEGEGAVLGPDDRRNRERDCVSENTGKYAS